MEIIKKNSLRTALKLYFFLHVMFCVRICSLTVVLYFCEKYNQFIQAAVPFQKISE